MQISVKYYSEYRRYTIDLQYVRRNANGGALTQKHRSLVQKRTYKLERLMSSAPSDTWKHESVFGVQSDTDLYNAYASARQS